MISLKNILLDNGKHCKSHWCDLCIIHLIIIFFVFILYLKNYILDNFFAILITIYLNGLYNDLCRLNYSIYFLNAQKYFKKSKKLKKLYGLFEFTCVNIFSAI